MKENSKRFQILSAAKDCFKVKGYYGSGVEEIAKKAGITKSLLYYYFKSKDDIFIALLEESLERILTSVSLYSSKSLKERFENLLLNIRNESEILSIALVDLFMEDNKTNVILELSRLEFTENPIKYEITDEKKLLYVMFIIRAVSFYSLGEKICRCFDISYENAEAINKKELFNLYKSIHSGGIK